MQSDIEAIYKKGIRLTPDAYEFLEKQAINDGVLAKILSSGAVFLTRETAESYIASEEKIPVQAIVNRAPDFKPSAREHEPNYKLIDKADISGKSNCTGKLEDFVGYFRNRFERIEKILASRASQYPIVKTNKLKETQGGKVRLIGMVTQKRVTKKENLLFDIEDEEGAAKVVLTKESKYFKAAQKVLLDDIVAFDGKNADELFIADEVTWPEMPFNREIRKTKEDIAIAYISDLHFGSKKFMDKEFSRFISWLNGAEGNADLAGKVKYVVICGDVVDGIGIYPEQEKELAVKDIYKQYEMFDSAMEQLPDYITVFVAPGNHDAVRRAEPQPQISYDLMKSDVVRVGNPSKLEIEGLKHLIYHGTSLDSIIAALGIGYDKPADAMIELMKRRHLSPIYGDNLIVPEGKDYLVIDEEPDVFHVGHVHKNGYTVYRGAHIVNSGTFQDRTDFQVRMGHMPSPAEVQVLEGKTGKMHKIIFREGVAQA